MRDKFLRKWQLWPKNVITQILQRLYYLIFTLAIKQNEIRQGIDRKHMKIPQHLEVRSPKFEIDDLKKLIKSTTQDLEEADRKRRDDFKRYEMEKKFEKEERLKHIEDEAKRKEEQDRYVCVQLRKKKRFNKTLCMGQNYPNYRWCGRGRGNSSLLKNIYTFS